MLYQTMIYKLENVIIPVGSVGTRCIEVTNEQEQQFLYLTTKAWKTGRQHRIEIWFVSYADKYYVVSERKEKAHWVQNIIHDQRVLFTVNSSHLKVLHEWLINILSIN